MDRSKDWLRQAERELEVANSVVADGFYEQACFLAQQAAEKAVKALGEAKKVDLWGHMISELLPELSASVTIPGDIEDAAKRLDHHYIPTRYPNAFHSGAPVDYYTAGQAEEAITHAEKILAFCNRHIPG